MNGNANNLPMPPVKQVMRTLWFVIWQWGIPSLIMVCVLLGLFVWAYSGYPFVVRSSGVISALDGTPLSGVSISFSPKCKNASATRVTYESGVFDESAEYDNSLSSSLLKSGVDIVFEKDGYKKVNYHLVASDKAQENRGLHIVMHPSSGAIK